MGWDGTNFIIGTTSYQEPLKIVNNTSTMITVSISLSSPINNNANAYLIAGSEYFTFDGNSEIISITNTTAYGGFIQNTFSNVTIQNIYIIPIASSPAGFAGWVCRPSLQNTTVTNCYSSGSVGTNGGGIVGSHCLNCTISNCRATGNIDGTGSGVLLVHIVQIVPYQIVVPPKILPMEEGVLLVNYLIIPQVKIMNY